MTASTKNIILCGFMASGKTTVGRMLAELTSRKFVDTDALIEEESGMTIAAIFEREGEAVFREKERTVIERVTGGEGLIIAVGGGAVLDRRNLDAMRRNSVIYWLMVTPEDAALRAGASGARPLLPDAPGEIAELLGSREEAYRKAADAIIDTGNRSPGDVAQEIAAEFRRREMDEEGTGR